VLATAGAVTSRVVWDDEVEELYRQHRGALVGLAAALVDDRGRAAELVQDVFAALLAGRRPAAGSELAYLRRAVLNRSRSELRRRQVRRATVVPAPVPPADDPDRRAAVLAAVRSLPRRQRECVVLRFYEDLGDADIASTLGISAGAVKQHLHRARGALAGALEGER
jgi:RNA polymerase sigma-70 factor (sigma-E family)